ncbi:MAG: hypothetical protein WA435_04925 [Gallionellaceae bacterium]
MKKFFDLQKNNWLIYIFALGILLTGIWARSFALGNAFYGDAFDDGEFAASLMSVLAENIRLFTIHGALHWIPGWFSQQSVGIDKHFLPTMLVHNSLDALAGLFLYVNQAG